MRQPNWFIMFAISILYCNVKFATAKCNALDNNDKQMSASLVEENIEDNV